MTYNRDFAEAAYMRKEGARGSSREWLLADFLNSRSCYMVLPLLEGNAIKSPQARDKGMR